MNALPDRHAQSVGLIITMAVCSAMLRLSMALANALVLWRVYGRSRVLREHLQITGIKPELVVSNGDVLRGLTFQHYLTGVAIWLATSFLAMVMLYHFVLPPRLQRILNKPRTTTPDILGTIWALGLFLLVTALLPLSAALAVAVLALVFAVSSALYDTRRSQPPS